MFMCVYLLIYLRKRKSHLFCGHLVLKAYFQHGCRLYVQLTGLTAESGLICRVQMSSREYWNRPQYGFSISCDSRQSHSLHGGTTSMEEQNRKQLHPLHCHPRPKQEKHLTTKQTGNRRQMPYSQLVKLCQFQARRSSLPRHSSIVEPFFTSKLHHQPFPQILWPHLHHLPIGFLQRRHKHVRNSVDLARC